MRTITGPEDTRRMSNERTQRNGGTRTQIPQPQDRIPIIPTRRQQMQSLGRIPRNVGNGMADTFGTDLTPHHPGLDIPNGHYPIRRCRGHNMGDRRIPRHGRHFGRRWMIIIPGFGTNGSRRIGTIDQGHTSGHCPGTQMKG